MKTKLKILLITAAIFFIGINASYAQSTITDILGGGQLSTRTSVAFYKYPYFYHADNTTLHKYNINTYTDSATSFNGMTSYSDGLGSIVIGNGI